MSPPGQPKGIARPSSPTAIAGFGVSRGRLPGATPEGCEGSGRDCSPRSDGDDPGPGDHRRGRGAVRGRRRERVAPAVDDADIRGAALLRLALPGRAPSSPSTAAPPSPMWDGAHRVARPRQRLGLAEERVGQAGHRPLHVDRRRPRRRVLGGEQPRRGGRRRIPDRRSGARDRRRPPSAPRPRGGCSRGCCARARRARPPRGSAAPPAASAPGTTARRSARRGRASASPPAARLCSGSRPGPRGSGSRRFPRGSGRSSPRSRPRRRRRARLRARRRGARRRASSAAAITRSVFARSLCTKRSPTRGGRPSGR